MRFRRRLRRLVAWPAGTVALALWAAAGPAGAQTLEEELGRLIENHPQILAEVTLEENTQNLLLSGAEAYIDVIAKTYLLDLARINEEAIRQQVELEERKVGAGSGTAVDVALARSRLQIAQERRVVFANDYQTATIRFTQIFQRPPRLETMIEPALPLPLLPGTLEEAIEQALTRSTQLATNDRQIDIARARQRSARADFFRRLDLVGRAGYREDVDAAEGERRDFSVLLQATWDLFSGFSKQANSSQAASTYSASLYDRQFTANRVREQVRLAWTALGTSCQRAVLLRSAVAISERVQDSRVKLRAAGRATDLDVLDAQTQSFNTLINMVSGLSDGMKSTYRMMFAMGKLDLSVLIGREYGVELPVNPLVRCDPTRRNPFEIKFDTVKVLRASVTATNVGIENAEDKVSSLRPLATPELSPDFSVAVPADGEPTAESAPGRPSGGEQAALAPEGPPRPLPRPAFAPPALPATPRAPVQLAPAPIAPVEVAPVEAAPAPGPSAQSPPVQSPPVQSLPVQSPPAQEPAPEIAPAAIPPPPARAREEARLTPPPGARPAAPAARAAPVAPDVPLDSEEGVAGELPADALAALRRLLRLGRRTAADATPEPAPDDGLSLRRNATAAP